MAVSKTGAEKEAVELAIVVSSTERADNDGWSLPMALSIMAVSFIQKPPIYRTVRYVREDKILGAEEDGLARLRDLAACAHSGRQGITECPGGRPIVEGLICVHCDHDPSDGKCLEPREP